MTNDNNHIDKLFNDNLKDYKINNTPEDLHRISKSLNKFNFFKFGFSHFNIYLIGIFAALTIGGFIIVRSMDSNNLNNDNKTQAPAQINNTDNSINDQNHIIKKEDKTFHSEETKTVENKETESQIEAPDDNTQEIEANSNHQTNEQNKMNTKSTEAEQPLDTIVKYVRDTVYTVKKVIVHDTIKKVIKKPVPRRNK